MSSSIHLNRPMSVRLARVGPRRDTAGGALTDRGPQVAQHANAAMSTAEDIYTEVKTLSEAEARAVLDVVVRIKGKREVSNEARPMLLSRLYKDIVVGSPR